MPDPNGIPGLRPIRTQTELTQKQLAERVGVTSDFIGMIENGRSCSLGLLNKFSDVFGVRREEFLSTPTDQRLREIKAAYLARAAAQAAEEARAGAKTSGEAA